VIDCRDLGQVFEHTGELPHPASTSRDDFRLRKVASHGAVFLSLPDGRTLRDEMRVKTFLI
jgi:hypothetical protein